MIGVQNDTVHACMNTGAGSCIFLQSPLLIFRTYCTVRGISAGKGTLYLFMSCCSTVFPLSPAAASDQAINFPLLVFPVVPSPPRPSSATDEFPFVSPPPPASRRSPPGFEGNQVRAGHAVMRCESLLPLFFFFSSPLIPKGGKKTVSSSGFGLFPELTFTR